MRRVLFAALFLVLLFGFVTGCSQGTDSAKAVPTSTTIAQQVTEVKTPAAEPVAKVEVATPTPANSPTPTPVPLMATPVLPTATPAVPTATKVPPTATPVPPTATPAMTDRDALKAYVNKLWPNWDKYWLVYDTYLKEARQAKSKNEYVGAVDRLVKGYEALLPSFRAMTAPNVPFAQAFQTKFLDSLEKEYDAMKRVNWGLVTNDDKVLDQALDDLDSSYDEADQSIWELKAAVEKQGLKYNSQTKLWE